LIHWWSFHGFVILLTMEGLMRNKAKKFPNKDVNRFEGEPQAKEAFASRRANGTINTHPQERMHASGQRAEEPYPEEG
jgi:small acid-soluble spore protein K (minor)